MAKEKSTVFYLPDVLKRAKEALGKVIETRYVVIEVTPGRYDNERDTTWPDRSVRVLTAADLGAVADYFRRFDPDEGKHFEVYEENLYEKTVQTWHLGKQVDTTDASVVEL